MASSSIKYYLKEYNTTNPEVEITSYYNCGVTETSGIMEFGEIKSIYSETFAETSSLKIYSAPTVARKLPEIKINLIFMGANFQQNYENFVVLISGKRYEYRDTLRRRKCFIILNKEVKTSSDNISDYLEAELSFLQFRESQKV